MSSIFENAKPDLLGDDTHAANLSGDVVSDLTVNQPLPSVASAVNCVTQAVNFVTIGSTSLTITSAKNEILLRGTAGFRLSSGNSQTVRIIRDGDTGDVLATKVTDVAQSGVWTLEATIIDETPGAHTYQWQIKMTSGQAETCCVENQIFFNIFSEAIDTHAANLSGDNTQRTHESEVLP